VEKLETSSWKAPIGSLLAVTKGLSQKLHRQKEVMWLGYLPLFEMPIEQPI